MIIKKAIKIKCFIITCYINIGEFFMDKSEFFHMFVFVGVFNNGPGAAVKLYNLTAASVHGPKQRNLRFTESQRQTREKQK